MKGLSNQQNWIAETDNSAIKWKPTCSQTAVIFVYNITILTLAYCGKNGLVQPLYHNSAGACSIFFPWILTGQLPCSELNIPVIYWVTKVNLVLSSAEGWKWRQTFSISHSLHGIGNELYQLQVPLHFELKAALQMSVVTGNRRRRQPSFKLPISLPGWGILWLLWLNCFMAAKQIAGYRLAPPWERPTL